MAVTLFQRKGPGGRSMVVSTDVASLRDSGLGTSPGAMDMTIGNDAVLLFKQKDYKGDCLCRRGRQLIRDLGSAKEGGKYGFGNTVSSIRLKPFDVPLNISLVKKPDGILPGNWTSQQNAEVEVLRVVARANELLASQKALMHLDIDMISRLFWRESEEYFDLTNKEDNRLPSGWKSKGQIDVLIVNSFEKDGVAGRGKPPGRGQAVIVAKTSNNEWDLSFDQLALVLVHEIGHYLGLTHRSSRGDEFNIMAPNASADPFEDFVFDDDQIAEMHNKLAHNLYRMGDRRV